MKVKNPLSAFEAYKQIQKSKNVREEIIPKKKTKRLQRNLSNGMHEQKLKNAATMALQNQNNEQIINCKKNIVATNSHGKKKCKIQFRIKPEDSYNGKNIIDSSENGSTKKRKRKHKSAKNVLNKSDSSLLNNSLDSSVETINLSSKSKCLPNTMNSLSSEMELFQMIISPISVERFFKNYWETKYLHIKRSKPEYFKSLLNSSTLDKMFRENSLYYTRNVDVVVYENEKKEIINPEGKATPVALWDYYQNGCSIRVLNPQTYNEKLHLLVTTLQEFFGSMVGINVYLTPPGSQGFAPHFDDIEAFVLQLEGKKHWKLYQPSGDDILARFSSKNFKHEEIGSPFFDDVLEAGDVLYFPRGTIHEAKTDQSNHSLHITVSVYQNTAYIDFFEKVMPVALASAAKNCLEFRKGLPLQYLKNAGVVNKNKRSEIRSLLEEDIKKMSAELVNYILDNIDHGVDQLGRKLMHDSMPPRLSHKEEAGSVKEFGDIIKDGKVLNKFAVSVNTFIRLSRYHSIRLAKEEENYRLYYCTENAMIYHGEDEQWLEIDDCMLDAIRFLQNSYPNYIKVKDLPIESVDSREQFVFDL